MTCDALYSNFLVRSTEASLVLCLLEVPQVLALWHWGTRGSVKALRHCSLLPLAEQLCVWLLTAPSFVCQCHCEVPGSVLWFWVCEVPASNGASSRETSQGEPRKFSSSSSSSVLFLFFLLFWLYLIFFISPLLLLLPLAPISSASTSSSSLVSFSSSPCSTPLPLFYLLYYFSFSSCSYPLY